MPLDGEGFDAACAPLSPALRLAQLSPGARGAVVVGSGGRLFFDRFVAEATEAQDGAPEPLDRYTKRLVQGLAAQTLGGSVTALFFPFTDSVPALPFQRLGRAAGVGPASPLGLQIHPTYGPWWAYRALVAVDVPLERGRPLGDVCDGCPAPCITACPGDAVARDGFRVSACHAHRRVAAPCRLSCAARVACVRAPDQRYSVEQLAFHMRASMPRQPASSNALP